MRKILAISRAVRDGFYQDLGETEVLETTIEELKIKVIPHEGHHASIEYIITLKWDEEWPLVFIDSEIIIDDFKDKIDGEDEISPVIPKVPEEIKSEKEKKELEKEKVKTSKQDEMRLGLDLLKRFQKPKIQRQRIRLYNPNL